MATASALLARLTAPAARDGVLEREQILFGQLINWHVRLSALDAAFALAGRLADARAASGTVAVRAMHQWWRADMRAFRDDPRFAALVERLALPAAWRRLGWPDGYDARASAAGPGRAVSARPPRRAR